MVVRSIGNSLMVILPELIGKKITNWFDLVRPTDCFQVSVGKKLSMNIVLIKKELSFFFKD